MKKGIKIKRMAAVLLTGMFIALLAGCGTQTDKKEQKNDSKKELRESKKAKELKELRITHVTAPLNVPSIVQKEKKMFEKAFQENGKDVKISYQEITSGADQTQALASGDIDVLYGVGATSVVLSAANEADIKVLNMYSRSPEAFCMYAADDTIRSAQDLKGKTIAGPAGTNLHQLLVEYLAKHGMSIDDVEYVNMSIPDAKAGLDGGSVDVALVAGATAYQAKEQGYHLIADGTGFTDALIAVAVRKEFYDTYKEELDILVNAQKELIAYMESNKDEIVELTAKELDLTKEAVEEMYRQYDFHTEITEKDKKAFQAVADFMVSAGMMEETFDTKKLFV